MLKKAIKLALPFALCCLLALGSARAEVTVNAEMGYEGLVTYLSAMPLRLQVENTGADAQLVAALNVMRDRSEYDRYEYPFFLAGGAQINLTMPVNLSYRETEYSVEILQDGQRVAQCAVKPQKTVSPATLLVGVLANDASAMSYLNISTVNDTLLRGEAWQTVALSGETFPETLEYLRAFSILAVDGVDIGTLSDAQRETLRAWIEQGGIAICGGGVGAVAAYRGFGALTGISTGAPYQAQGVDQALRDYLAGTQFPTPATGSVAGAVMLAPVNGGDKTVAELDGKPLIVRSACGRGVVYTTAFSLSERPLSGWSGMDGFWQRVLLNEDYALYQQIVNSRGYYNDDANVYPSASVLRYLRMENDAPVLAVVLGVAALIFLSGLGSYWILKRVDKREWMWLTVPLLSLLGMGAVYLLSGGMTLRQPAGAAYSVIRVASDGQVRVNTTVGVATADLAPITVSAAKGDTLRPLNFYLNYWEDDDGQTVRKPELRYCFTQGDTMSVTVPVKGVWAVQSLGLAHAQTPDLPVRGAIWWEEDGLHGEIVNESAVALEAGFLFCSNGYCRVPALLPGERAAVAILENPGRDKSDRGIYEGELLENSYPYDVLQAAVYPERYATPEGYKGVEVENAVERMVYADMIASEIDLGVNTAPIYHYVTLPEETINSEILLNGEKLTRLATASLLDVEVQYQVVGKDGLLRIPAGLTPLYRARSAEGELRVDERLDGYNYFMLRDEPVYCFALGEIEGLDWQKAVFDKAVFNCDCYGSRPRFQLYNATQGVWQEVQYSAMPVNLEGAAIQECLDARGRLFIRLSAADGEADNARLTLEGRME